MAGGPYNIPRNTKGESRFFNVFSVKALIETGVIGGLAFMIFYPLSLMLGNPIIGIVITVIFGLIAFVISSFKIPESNNFELTRKAGGEYIDQIIIRYFKFKMRKNRIYTFFTEEKKDE
jgi:hypothetical protein